MAIATYFLQGMEDPHENKDAQSAVWISKELNIPRVPTEQIKVVICETRRCAAEEI